ncbi:hypothetical protein ACN08N_04655 [Photobacterium leiognathi subsp. mandapamensis]|uniref:hypothetical protein n=1 Tax=Photobacterium leiognathi TaxID=553611 RepID=UPI003AF3B1BC
MLLSMSPKELNRVDVIRDISERRLRQKDAAELLKLSRRHIQRACRISSLLVLNSDLTYISS